MIYLQKIPCYGGATYDRPESDKLPLSKMNGDVYYRTAYAEQNYDRAKNQLTLLKQLEGFLKSEYDYKL